MISRKSMEKSILRIRRSLKKRRFDGGPGSGNWGHEGRPGKVGGSGEGGGKHNRQTKKEGGYTSFSQEHSKEIKEAEKARKKLAKPHGLTQEDMDKADKITGSKIFVGDEIFVREKNGWMRETTGTSAPGFFMKEFIGQKARVVIPKDSGEIKNPNYKITKEDKATMAMSLQKIGKAFNPKDVNEADDAYRKQAGEVWKQSPEKTKRSLNWYTDLGYRMVNSTIREGEADYGGMSEPIDEITEALNRSEFDRDVVLHRGLSKDGAEKLFGLPKGYLSGSVSEENISMVGRIGTDDGFVSTGAAVGTGFSTLSHVSLEIFAPKGTKGLYCEPFSKNGLGDGLDWDGESSQKAISPECEILLQRGCTFQVIGHEIAVNELGIKQHKLKVALIRQDPDASEYSKKRKQTE